MAIIKVNPFRPGSPVPPGVFAGRIAELTQIVRAVIQTQSGQPQNILITGERGIGKTSIAHFTKALVEGQIEWPFDPSLNVAKMTSAYIAVQKNTEPVVVVSEVIRELEHQLSTFKWAREALDSFTKTFSEITVAGTGFKLRNKSEVTAHTIYSEAQRSIRVLCEKYTNTASSDKPSWICITIDELDRMNSFEGFSSFWKTLMERLAADQASRLMLVFVGMPEVQDFLADDHPSLLRIFSPIYLDKMPEAEAQSLIKVTLKKGVPQKTMSEEAIRKVLFYSENFPHLIHELGYSAFEVSEGDQVTEQDVENGLHGTSTYGGSIERLGSLFFDKMYNEVRKSEGYKEILGILADLSGPDHKWVTRQEILNRFSKGKTSLDGSLNVLVKKEVIIRNPDQVGEYKLVSKMFQAYVDKILQQNKA